MASRLLTQFERELGRNILGPGDDCLLIPLTMADKRAARVNKVTSDSLKEEIMLAINQLLFEDPDRDIHLIHSDSAKKQLNIRLSDNTYKEISEFCARISKRPVDWVGDAIEEFVREHSNFQDAAWKKLNVSKFAAVPTRDKDKSLSPWIPEIIINHLAKISRAMNTSRNNLVLSLIAFNLHQQVEYAPPTIEFQDW